MLRQPPCVFRASPSLYIFWTLDGTFAGNLRFLSGRHYELRAFLYFRVHSYTPISCLQFPKLCREEVSIHVIQSREHILNTVCLSGTQSKDGGLMFTVF